MEFGLFLNGYLPGPAAHDPDSEHTMLMREVGYAIHADGYNWKYVWFGEHHALTEYSHMSAPEVVLGYVAAQTDQIHMGSAIMNLSKPVNHPVRNAERVAMLDHITGNRYEWGTGRGAGSHEMATFDLLTSETKAMWDEAAAEILRMWEQRDYTFDGEFFKVEQPHNVLPKPYGIGHPPLWVGCGNPGTFTKAGRAGHRRDRVQLRADLQPQGSHRGLQGGHRELQRTARAVHERQRDDDQRGGVRRRIAARAREIAMSAGRGYLNTMVNMYHDTMPPQKHAVMWPNPPHRIPDEATLDFLIESGYLLCGDPDDVNEQIEKYQQVGCDQLVFGIPNEGFEHEEVLEMIELFGSKVIPNFDTEHEHRTTRFRREAKRKYPDFAHPLPDGLEVEVIPTNALVPLAD